MKGKTTEHWESHPSVQYHPDTQTLLIDNGQPLTEGEDLAKGVTVFYAKGQGEQGGYEISGLTIEWAEATLRPFVDAILAKYGVKQETPMDVGKAKAQ